MYTETLFRELHKSSIKHKLLREAFVWTGEFQGSGKTKQFFDKYLFYTFMVQNRFPLKKTCVHTSQTQNKAAK